MTREQLITFALFLDNGINLLGEGYIETKVDEYLALPQSKIDSSSLTVGHKLTAIDVCKMDGSGNKALTIGKEYPVLEVDKKYKRIRITDDDGSPHYFTFSDIDKYFK